MWRTMFLEIKDQVYSEWKKALIKKCQQVRNSIWAYIKNRNLSLQIPMH